MTCKTIDLPGVGRMIVCDRDRARRQPCKFCGDPIDGNPILCDWKLTGTKAGSTCDARMCRRCAAAVGDDKDLCPPHKRAWDKHPSNSTTRNIP